MTLSLLPVSILVYNAPPNVHVASVTVSLPLYRRQVLRLLWMLAGNRGDD